MKMAILIMAHHQPAHLAKLVQMLSCDWTRIFIHIDRKVDIAEFIRLAPKHKNIRFLNINQRIRVFWGGFSQVRATLNLLNMALSSGEDFKRFCLLSGSDFPIKLLSHIKASFDTEKEFIRIDRRLGNTGNNFHCHNARYLHFMDSWFLRKVHVSGVMPRKVYNKIPLYQGAQWWSLTNGCVKYILSFLQNNRDFIYFHKWTLVPDEIFFHSIIKYSPFASNITHDFEQVSSYLEYLSLNEHGCTYIDWNAKDVPLPKILTVDDYDSLGNSPCLFARKFDERKSAGLREMLEMTNSSGS